MRRRTRTSIALAAAGVLTLGLVVPAQASPPIDDHPDETLTADALKSEAAHRDELPLTPQQQEQRDARMDAISAVVTGEAAVQQRGESRGVQLPDGQWVQWGTPDTDEILTFLVGFGDQISEYGGDPGPSANEIPEPDRAVDNTTAWEPDYSRDFYQELLFSEDGPSMTDFYLEQSGGRYTVTGSVEDWVTVPYNEARYGSNDADDGYGVFVKDSAQAWYDAQVAAGKSTEEIRGYLSRFDQWDRYDFDADGNFDEADGYIDHFQAIHAGEGEEAGGGAQGEDAIWSHRWFAHAGFAGPDHNPSGGVPIGDTGIWIGDYTTEPENGGLGVFAHEYGHDLGLPDLYDTRGGDNGTGFWTLMSTGSWLGTGRDAIGDMPGFMGPWEKFFLGWLDYDMVDLNKRTSYHLLGAAGRSYPFKQATLVNLPPVTVVNEYTKPVSGSYEWMGGDGDDINAALSRDLDLTGATTSASLSAKVRLDTEEGYDYFFAQVSTDGGGTWKQLGDKLSGDNGGFADTAFDLSAYAGQTVKFRYRYTTDGNTHGTGVFIDDIVLTVDGAPAWSDDVESGDNGWTAYNWKRTTGTETDSKARFYLVENRQYVSYDKTLKSGPYQFGWANTSPDKVQHFPYQNGALVWYVDTTVADNDTSRHPGKGLALPVDARPAPLLLADGTTKARARLQVFDATFGTAATDKLVIYQNGNPVTYPSRPGVAEFDDSDPMRYWSADNPQSSVQVAGEGVKIKVLWDGKGKSPMLISVKRT